LDLISTSIVERDGKNQEKWSRNKTLKLFKNYGICDFITKGWSMCNE